MSDQPKVIAEASSRTRIGVLDCTLATEALLEMTPEAIMGGADDPEGLRLGDEVVRTVLAELTGPAKETETAPPADDGN